MDILKEIPELTKEELKAFKKIANEEGGVARLQRANISRTAIDGIRFDLRKAAPITRLKVRQYLADHPQEVQKEKKKAA